MTISLGALIVLLEKADPKKVVSTGLGEFFSFRGEPVQLAASIKSNVAVASMLEKAREAVGKTFEGYKGGLYPMGLHSQVNLTFSPDSMDSHPDHFIHFVNDLFHDSELHAYKVIPVDDDDDDDYVSEKIIDLRPFKLFFETQNQFVINLILRSEQGQRVEHKTIKMPSYIKKADVIDFLNFIFDVNCLSDNESLDSLEGFDKWASHECHDLKNWILDKNRINIYGFDVYYYDEHGNRVIMETIEK